MFEPEEQGLSPLQAFDAVMAFARRRGPAALQLALHAALPQVVHVDLAQLLRLNFVPGGPRPGVLEADLLFAPFCADLGNGYFRFDANARLQLLQQLDPGTGAAGNERSLQVADFLLAYLDRERVSERGDVDPLYRSWLEIERWNALAFRDPEATAEQLAAAVQQACAPGQTRARLRVGTLAASLATPLLRHQRLLRYAAGVEALQTQPADAARLLAALGDEPLRVGPVELPAAATLLQSMAVPAAQAVVEALAEAQVEPRAEAAAEPEQAVEAVSSASPAGPADAAKPRALRELRDCAYTAYLSHAQADDAAWFNWVTQFGKELQLSLAALLRGHKLPPLHYAAQMGPQAGDSGSELQQRLAASWSLIVVVHDNYLHSEWCLRELELFKALYGQTGLRERLYILALSEPAMRELSTMPRWQRLWDGQEPLWLPFFDPEDRARPLDVYAGPGLVSQAFRGPFERLRSDLGAKLRRSLNSAPPAPVAPSVASAAPAPTRAQAGVACLYIESNRHEPGLWEPLGEYLRQRWGELCAQLAPHVLPVPVLRPRGLPLDQIDSFPALDDADGVLLLWGRKTPEALMAQINKVEAKLPAGREAAAPGLVAYLVPPQQPSEAPLPAWGWQVLRFDVADPGQIQLPPEDLARLDRFLRKMLDRVMRRPASSAA